MEYDYCLFCGEKAFGYKRKATIGGKTIEWFICIDCEMEKI